MADALEPRLERVREMVRSHVRAGGRVLEVSCGKALLLAWLKDDGFNVRGTNFTKYSGQAKGVPIDAGVDLLKGTPYDGASFDCVLILDVMEHLSDHHRAVAEVCRVLREDGVLIVFTPNIMRINSRLHFLLTGFFKIKRSFIGFDVPPERAFAFHNYPVHLPVFLYQLSAVGLDCIHLGAFGYKAKSILYWLLLGPWIAVFTWINCRLIERNLKGTAAGRRIASLLLSVKALNAESILFVARKKTLAESSPITTRMPKWSQPATSKRESGLGVKTGHRAAHCPGA
jgi:SAM-dependent methyltransferase